MRSKPLKNSKDSKNRSKKTKSRAPAGVKSGGSAKLRAQPDYPSPFKRLETGIPGMDTVLGGGLLEGGTYLLLGRPGAGKTIFANQLSFHASRDGRKALYVTLLAENHGRMFGHLETLSFFDRSRVSDSIQYVSGYGALEKDGLDGLMKLLGALVHRYRASVLFIDGVATADELGGSSVNFKKFVHNLNSVLGLSSCTTFLLSSSIGDGLRPEYTMVDGIIHLRIEEIGMQRAREIEVTKFRGSSHLFGRHFFEINNSGIVVYPRIDSILGRGTPTFTDIETRRGSGVPGLDAVLGGGYIKGSITSLIGPTGSGKTSVGMRFLEEGAKRGEQGLFVSLYEHPARMEPKLADINTPVAKYFKSGLIDVVRQLPVDMPIDKLAYDIYEGVKAKKAQRLFIDGIGGLKDRAVLGSDRLQGVMKALTAELRNLGVTTLFVEETDTIEGLDNGLLSYDSSITDNTLEFSQVHLQDTRRVAINALKTRESAQDPRFFELQLTTDGPRVGSPLKFLKPRYPVVEFAMAAADDDLLLPLEKTPVGHGRKAKRQPK